MLTKTLKYETFDGQPAERTVYFNLTKAELVDMTLRAPNQDLSQFMEDTVKSGDGNRIMDLFDYLLRRAYGVREKDLETNEDIFVKSQTVYDRFKASAAYSDFFLQLVTDADIASTFVNQIMPADLVRRAAEEAKQSQRAQPQDHQQKAAPYVQNDRQTEVRTEDVSLPKATQNVFNRPPHENGPQYPQQVPMSSQPHDFDHGSTDYRGYTQNG